MFISNNHFLLTDKGGSSSFPQNVIRFSWNRKWVSATCTRLPAFVAVIADRLMLPNAFSDHGSDVFLRCTLSWHQPLFIHDLTYKARTLTVHTRRPGDHRACQAWALVFHNTTSRRMSLGHHFTGLVWGTCLNGSHCKCICHPLFCGSFWQCPKVS